MDTIMKRQRYYYVCFVYENKEFIISTSMQYIADNVGVSQKTISRGLSKGDIYEGKGFIVQKDVELHTIKRGFAIK